MPKTSGPPDFGEWWFTPFELNRVARYFGVDLSHMTPGRTEGRSALHGALGLLSEWYRGSADQLSLFHAVKTRVPIYAMYGEGDVATTTGYGRTIKPIRLNGGGAARQVFLPKPWTYAKHFARITAPTGADTDSGLMAAVMQMGGQKLPFE